MVQKLDWSRRQRWKERQWKWIEGDVVLVRAGSQEGRMRPEQPPVRMQEFYNALSLRTREVEGIPYYRVGDVADHLRRIPKLSDRLARLEEGLAECSLRINNEHYIGRESTFRFFEDERLLPYVCPTIKSPKAYRL